MKGYIMTIKRSGIKHKDLMFVWEFLQFCLNNDIKKWIIGAETGTFGYKHWQIRLETRWTFEQMKVVFGEWDAHIEETNNWNDYERKEGNYIAWNDNIRQLQQRFGNPRMWQKYIINRLAWQNDRQITVLVDNKGGNIGKSWLTGHLYEKGIAFPVPATLDTVKGIVQFIANGYNNEAVIVIDIPRSWKWTKQLVTSLESIKSGIVYDSRYKTTIRNISPAVLVFCNTAPNQSWLSKDRWDLVTVKDGAIMKWAGEKESP